MRFVKPPYQLTNSSFQLTNVKIKRQKNNKQVGLLKNNLLKIVLTLGWDNYIKLI